jgi:hypothetical protein
MHQTFKSMDYAHDEAGTWQRASIPFDNGGALTILLPEEGHFDELAHDSDQLRWAFSTCAASADNSAKDSCAADNAANNAADNDEAAAGREVTSDSRPVDMALPTFDIENSFQSDDIMKTFEAMGVVEAFDQDNADFTRMVDIRSHGENLFIGSIIQGTAIKVNESGAKAAAYTKVGMTTAGMEVPVDLIEFTVDRPFLYSYTTPDGIPLFIGMVRDLPEK